MDEIPSRFDASSESIEPCSRARFAHHLFRKPVVIGAFFKEWLREKLHWFRAIVYPGLDLHTRSRAALCVFWKTGPRDVLDAGSGNGYFSWLAYKSGARVLALNNDKKQVNRARNFLLGYKKADKARLQFEHFDLYDLGSMTRRFDEIICYEVLEHLRRDEDVLREFFRILNPGGVLHLCCPYRLHRHHQFGHLDPHESGGHVRPGYTLEDYRAVLEPLGFRVDTVVGIGGTGLYIADLILRAVRNLGGDGFALPLFVLMLPFVWIDRFNPLVPFSLYVRVTKPAHANDR